MKARVSEVNGGVPRREWALLERSYFARVWPRWAGIAAGVFVAGHFLLAGAAGGAELLVNGGFEDEPHWNQGIGGDGSYTDFLTNAIPGWTIEPGHALTVHSNGPLPVISGTYSVNTDGSGYNSHNGNFYQDFSSSSNNIYMFSFDWEGWGYYYLPTTNQLKVSITDTTNAAVLFNGLYSYNGADRLNPHHINVTFGGTGHALRLRIEESPESGYNDNTFIVDSFSVMPMATTLPAGGISNNCAALQGAANLNGASAVVWFEWGQGLRLYGQQTPPVSYGSGLTNVPVGRLLTSLSAGQYYHYRLVVSNSVGTARGDDVRFWYPLVTVNGANPLTNECHAAWTDPGATASASLTTNISIALSLRADGSVAGWGDNSWGQLNIPLSATNLTAVASGLGGHCMALRADGVALAWGRDDYGQSPAPANATNVIAIAAGGLHSLILRADHTIYGWGNNSYYQTWIPPAATNVVAIAAGYSHSMVLRADGKVLVWGDNSYGQTNVPANATNIVAIASGYNHCLALRANGTVLAWGASWAGQTNVSSSATNVVALAGGYSFSLALRADGKVVHWGGNFAGEGTIPPTVTNIMAIAAGYEHGVAFRGDGTILAWGEENSVPTSVSTVYPPVITVGTVNSNAPGYYSLTYVATNNLAAVVYTTRTVVVADTTQPVLTLLGSNFIVLPPGGSFTDPGATASDLCAGDLTSNILVSGTVNTNVLGTNGITYTVTDPSGNSSTTNRAVVVTAIPPLATTYGATGVIPDAAILTGCADPGGLQTYAWFEFGTTTNYGHTTTATNIGTGGVYVPLSIPQSGLCGPLTYHFRLVAQNSLGTAYGQDMSFSSLVSTNAGLSDLAMDNANLAPAFASGTTNYSATVSNAVDAVCVYATPLCPCATLQVQVNAQGFAAIDPDLGISDPLPLVAGTNLIQVKVTAQDAVTARLYSIAVIRLPGPPVVNTLPATGVGSTNALLNASVNPNGLSTTAWFDWGLTTNYGNRSTPASLGSGGITLSFSNGISGLTPRQFYHFRCVATNSAGTNYGNDIGIITLSASTQHRPPSFTGLGALPSANTIHASGVCNDGTIVAGWYSTGDSEGTFLWMTNSGLVDLGRWQAYGISGDGLALVGNAGIWTAEHGGPVLIGTEYDAVAVNDDGSAVVGNAVGTLGPEAFLRTETNGITLLGIPAGYDRSFAAGVSGDGSIVVGQAVNSVTHDGRIFRWTATEGMAELATLSQFGSVNGLSQDGMVVVGATADSQAFRWTQAGGVAALSLLSGGNEGFAYDVSGDGSIVVGACNQNTQSLAFVWDAIHGTRSLQTVLTNDYGLDLTGWTLEQATAISADGTTIAGNGMHNGHEEVFVATVDFFAWAGTNSGNWGVSTNWSPGSAPASTNSVYITSPGTKTVVIDTNTVAAAPDSLTVSNLTLSAPGTNQLTLLLDNAGTNSPLHVLNVCSVLPNATVVVTNSALNLGGLSLIDGALQLASGTVSAGSNLVVGASQGASGSLKVCGGTLTAVDGVVQVGPVGSGQMLISNGVATIRQLALGGPAPGDSGLLELRGGRLTILERASANFIIVGGGDLDGSGGTIVIGEGHDAAMEVTAGTTKAGSLYIGYTPGYTGTFTQSGGIVSVRTNAIVGNSACTALGMATLNSGAACFVTNSTHNAILDVRYGTFRLNAGATLMVDCLIVTNLGGHFIKNGGVLTAGTIQLDYNLDATGEGIPNSWKQAHGFDPLSIVGDDGAQGDPDHDGQNNLAEYLAGTDPRSAASSFRILSATPFVGHNVRLTWTTVGGHCYVVQTATSPAARFTDCSPVLTVTGTGEGTTSYTCLGGASGDAAYYRIRLGP